MSYRPGYRPLSVAEGYVPKTHGIISSYHRGCRCDECRAINAARQRGNGASRKLAAKRQAERVWVGDHWEHPNPYGGHGAVGAYTTCGCRCRACKDAMSASRTTRRHADDARVAVDTSTVFTYAGPATRAGSAD